MQTERILYLPLAYTHVREHVPLRLATRAEYQVYLREMPEALPTTCEDCRAEDRHDVRLVRDDGRYGQRWLCEPCRVRSDRRAARRTRRDEQEQAAPEYALMRVGRAIVPYAP